MIFFDHSAFCLKKAATGWRGFVSKRDHKSFIDTVSAKTSKLSWQFGIEEPFRRRGMSERSKGATLTIFKDQIGKMLSWRSASSLF
jgi:hypothetical protein